MSEYKTVWDEWKDVAEAHGITRKLFEQRIWTNKWTDEEAATIPKHQKRYNVQMWERWKETAEAHGVSRELFERRIWNTNVSPRWTEEQAAKTPQNKRRVFFNKWVHLAEENGIKRKTYYARVYDYGWTEERAATEPVKGKVHAV